MQKLSEAAFCDLSSEIILADMRNLSNLSTLGLDLDAVSGSTIVV